MDLGACLVKPETIVSR